MSQNETKADANGASDSLSETKRPYTRPVVQDFIDTFAVFGTNMKGERRQKPPKR